ncbi:MAG: hypothetical protein HQM13_08630 [SAR324 cluster bacterium]|nr:hypothetical protein [SAR324 cluster bacterium]
MMTPFFYKQWILIAGLLGSVFLLSACSADFSTTNSQDVSDNPPYTEWLTLAKFEEEIRQQKGEKRYPVEIQGRLIDGNNQFRAVFAPFTEPFSFFAFTELTEAEFSSQNSILSNFGFELQHLEKIAFTTAKLFTAVWAIDSGFTSKEVNPSSTATPTTITAECTRIASDNDGTLLQVDENVCLIMEDSDRAACRVSDSYANCKTFTEAKSICPGGTSNGSTAYLPTSTELDLFLDAKGIGSPLSNLNLCTSNSGPCLTSGTIVPVAYWSSTANTSSTAYHLHLDTGSAHEVSQTLYSSSVRCVKRIPL